MPVFTSSNLGICPSDDVTLSYRLFGVPSDSRTPVLFVHGLSYFSYDWVEFGASMCTDRAGCAMDMRGFGDSTSSPGADYSIPTMAADIGRLLDHLKWSRVILVAHSMGGRSATFYTAMHPERVAALVLVDWSPENAAAGSRRVAQTVANTPDVFDSVDHAMRYFGADSDSPAGKKGRARFEAYLRPVEGGLQIKRDLHFARQFRHQLATGEKPSHGVDLWQVLGQVAVPTLVLRGSRSDLFDAANVPRVQASNPLITVREIEAGHHVAGDNPADTRAAIRSFIDTQEQA